MHHSRSLHLAAASALALSSGGLIAAQPGPLVRRARTRDHFTFDSNSLQFRTTDSGSVYQPGAPIGGGSGAGLISAQARTHDGRTVDSTGAFLVGELERLDPQLNLPLVSYTWSRDIDLREDVTIADELSSWTNSAFAAAGGITPAGKNWIGKDSNSIPGIALDIGKTAQPLYLWGMELSYTIPELESAIRLGRPVDAQKYEGMTLKHQMDIDEQVYIGDATLGQYGLVNNPAVTAANVTGGTWAAAITADTPDVILSQVNEILAAAWAASGWAVVPNRLLVPPTQFGQLVSAKVSTAGNMSLLQYLAINSLSNAQNGVPLQILPSKWLVGRGAGETQRMVAYTKRKDLVRFPLVPLQRTPLEFRSIYHLTTYFGRLGVIEVVRPQTLLYRDGI